MIRILLVVLELAASLEDAERLFAEGRWAEARGAYETGLEGLEGDARAAALDRIGLTFLREGDEWQAEAAFVRSLEAAETAEARMHRGEALFFAARRVTDAPGASSNEIMALLNDAAGELKRATDLRPELAEAWTFAGLVARYRLLPEPEEESYRRALAAEPGRADASLYLSWILEQRGQVDEARTLLEAVPEGLRNPEHWVAIARLAQRAGAFAAALAAGLRAIEAAPEDPEGFKAVWNATAFRRMYTDFEEAMAGVLAGKADRWLAHYYLGFCRRDAKRPREALAAFAEAFRLNPGDVRAKLLCGDVLYVDLKDESAAIPVYLEVLAVRPDDDRARGVLASIAYERAQARDFETARRILAALRKADPANFSHALNLALVEREAGRPEVALAIYDEAVEAFPFEPQVPNDRGLLLIGLKRREEALASFRAALDRDPDFLDALENLGTYTLAGGDARGAAPYFLRAYDRARAVGGDVAKFRRYLDELHRRDER